MELKEFLEQNVGKWFSQRTSYDLKQVKTENSKAQISIELLSPENPEVTQLCQLQQINPKDSLAGIKTSWDNATDWGKPKEQGAATLVLIAENDQQGKILKSANNNHSQSIVGRYLMGNDEALTLIIEDEDTYWSERIWFASPNLRLRTTLCKNADEFTSTAFYSEIRQMTEKK